MRAMLLIGLLAAAPPAGDLTKLTPEQLARLADKDCDGKLSLEEFQATIFASPKHAPKLFKKSDKDGDDKLSFEECKAALESVPWWKLSRQPAEAIFKATDQDGGGKLSLEEFKQVDPHKNHYEAHFKKYNKAGDGKLSLAEFKAFVDSIVKD